MSRQHPLKDTLPNAVGLENKGSTPLLGKYACYVPQPISTPRLSLLAFSLPFCFHTSSSFLPLSLTIFSCVSLSTLCHQAVTRSTPFHIYLLLRLLFLSVSLSLIVFLLSILQSHWSHFFFASCSFNAFFPAPSLLSATPRFPLCSCFSLIRLFFCFVYFPSHSLPVEVGLNPNQLLNP